MCDGSLDHLDNCKSFGSLIQIQIQINITIFKHAFKYINEKISNILENASYKNANNKINFLFNNKLYSILRLTSSFISNCLNIRKDLL
jgi:hypothetical protein